MTYYFSNTIAAPFPEVVDRLKEALKAEGFGIITDINVRDVLKQKLGAEFREYRILGACNPKLAHRALMSEDKIGTILPCNTIVQDLGNGRVEVAAIDPRVGIGQIDNDELRLTADEAAAKLSAAVASV